VKVAQAKGKHPSTNLQHPEKFQNPNSRRRCAK
jgi:hypothetical protein